MGWFDLTPEVQWTLAGIFGVLVVASTLVAILRRRHPDRDYGELRQRINTWWMMVVVFTVAMILSRTVSIVFFAFVSFLALKEYLSLIPTRRALSPSLAEAARRDKPDPTPALPLRFRWRSRDRFPPRAPARLAMQAPN